MKVKLLSRTLSDPMDCSLPGSSIHGIFQARVLERGATAFSEALSYPVSTPSEWRKWSAEWYQDLLALITAVSLSGLAQSQLLLLLPSHFSRVRLLCDPMDCSPPGSPVPGILQAKVLEWGAIAFSFQGASVF